MGYDEIASGASAGASAVSGIISLAISILYIIAMWKLFEKAGEEGWKALIPFYNAYTLVKIAYGNGIMFLLLLIPVVNFVFIFIYMINLAKAFGKSSGFGIGLVFLAPIFMMILGFGSDQYIGPKGEPVAQQEYAPPVNNVYPPQDNFPQN
ncbi:MAG: DUF5684 domain-containing protein [Eubacterium sp.]|nr:DUF5684 domain-containing protein [Eubacterium sp.]